MSETLFDSQDGGEPPSFGRLCTSIKQLARLIIVPTNALRYSHLSSASGDSVVTVDRQRRSKFKIRGYIAGNERTPLQSIVRCGDTQRLRDDISQSMAAVAILCGSQGSDDPEYDYPVFMSAVEPGEVYFMFRDEARTGMMMSYYDERDDRLMIESKGIRDDYEQAAILLGGLAAFMAALEEPS